jgi:hypothetical protein
MPATAARVDVLGELGMPICSHITNNYASGHVRAYRADAGERFSYIPNMAKRDLVKDGAPWYLVEWMATIPDYRGWGAHTRFREKAGWSKATMSQLYNGEQPYNPVILKEAAQALSVEPYELLMPPETAMGYRSMRRGAFTIVGSDASDDRPESPGAGTGR